MSVKIPAISPEAQYFKPSSNQTVRMRDKEMNMSAQTTIPMNVSSPKRTYEFIDSKELALRWRLPESWIREQVRSRSADLIPHVRFGKYVRFRWGSPELEEWAERRIVSGSNRDAGRALGKERK
jgi:hypothetical protein